MIRLWRIREEKKMRTKRITEELENKLRMDMSGSISKNIRAINAVISGI